MTALKDPILGKTAKLAMRTHAGGHERQKLLVLLAAYHDAGEQPTVNALTARLGLTPGQTHSLLRALERQGLIRVQWAPPKSWRRNEYQLLFSPAR